MEATNLTAWQTRHGLSILRESLPGMTGTDAVYTYDPHGHLCRLEYIPEVAEAYEIMRITAEATRSYRILTGTVLPHYRHGRNKQIRLLRRHLEVVVEDARDILSPT